MEKEFAPNVVKFELIEDSNASIAVRIPINAVKPIAMIVIVITLLSRLALMALKAMLIFSDKSKI